MFYSTSTGGFYSAEIHGDNIPADAVEITAAYHAELLAAQSAGKRIEPDATGYPVAVDPPPPTLDQAQAAAKTAIDAEAGAARARYITVVIGQEATYMLKEAQARAHKSAGYPSATVADYPMVEAEAKALHGAAPTAAQIQSAADGIIAQADAWIAKAAQIERARIAGKRAVGAAVDVAGVETARAAAVAELGLL
ncbi:MAG: hypothetical protein ACYCZT_10400 [Thiobacillus sp.]